MNEASDKKRKICATGCSTGRTLNGTTVKWDEDYDEVDDILILPKTSRVSKVLQKKTLQKKTTRNADDEWIEIKREKRGGKKKK